MSAIRRFFSQLRPEPNTAAATVDSLAHSLVSMLNDDRQTFVPHLTARHEEMQRSLSLEWSKVDSEYLNAVVAAGQAVHSLSLVASTHLSGSGLDRFASLVVRAMTHQSISRFPELLKRYDSAKRASDIESVVPTAADSGVIDGDPQFLLQSALAYDLAAALNGTASASLLWPAHIPHAGIVMELAEGCVAELFCEPKGI